MRPVAQFHRSNCAMLRGAGVCKVARTRSRKCPGRHRREPSHRRPCNGPSTTRNQSTSHRCLQTSARYSCLPRQPMVRGCSVTHCKLRQNWILTHFTYGAVAADASRHQGFCSPQKCPLTSAPARAAIASGSAGIAESDQTPGNAEPRPGNGPDRQRSSHVLLLLGPCEIVTDCDQNHAVLMGFRPSQ